MSDQSSLVLPELPSCKRELTLLQEISYPKTNDYASVHDKRHVRHLVCNVVHRACRRAQMRKNARWAHLALSIVQLEYIAFLLDRQTARINLALSSRAARVQGDGPV